MKLTTYILKISSFLLLIIGSSELFPTGKNLIAGTIKLKSSMVIDHDLITVGDIADIQDFEPQTSQQLAQVTISPAPAAGRELLITHDLIRRQLTVRGWDLSTLLIQGYSQVQVTRLDSTTPNVGNVNQQQQNLVLGNLSQAIQRYYSQAGAEWATALVQIQMPPELPLKLLRISPAQLQLQGPAPTYNQVFTMIIAYPGQNQQMEQAQIMVMLKSQPRVLAVKNTIPKGYLIQERDLIYVSSNKPEQGISDPKLIVGHESIRAIRAEEPIEPTFLRRNPLVRVHDIVTVYVKSPSFSIQRQFKAKTEGAMGDTIQLVTLENKELISARITGFREAEIIPNGATDITPIPQGQQISLQPQTAVNSPGIQPVNYQSLNSYEQVPFQRFQRSNNDSQVQPTIHHVAKPTVTSNQPLSLTR